MQGTENRGQTERFLVSDGVLKKNRKTFRLSSLSPVFPKKNRKTFRLSPVFKTVEHPAVWYNLYSRNGQDGARVSRRYLPDRPVGLPEGVGGGQRRQYHHPDGCRADSCHANRRFEGHDAARRPDRGRHEIGRT